MDGARAEWAAAAALALVVRARGEKRPVSVVGFNTQPFDLACFLPGKPAGQDDFAWCGRNRGGGTDFNNSLVYAAKVISEMPAFKRADVVMVTDGDDENYEPTVHALRESGVDVYGVVIGCESPIAGATESIYVPPSAITRGTVDAVADVFAAL
jgi:uncharacterized protein with von Willebrand factor type A (vWA) domain